eukprot:snap_masked-scaffold_20-processed-gene-2.14-mRNA-1 protein AED:1.00 eAED:1.00 QI:0/0/0/0/1/1/2/0/167
MSRRLNATPSELFLHFLIKEPLYLQDLKHFAIYLADKILQPDQVIYNNVLLKREADNKIRDPSHNLILQFNVGGYFLILKEGTQSAKKTRVTWIGPFQITDLVSKDVYSVESLTNKTRLVHGSRLWWYSDSQPLGNKKLKAHLIHNFQFLEVEKFIGIGFSQDIRAR